MTGEELIAALHAKGVANVCPECGRPGIIDQVPEVNGFLGAVCAHCGHTRFFHGATLQERDP